MTVRLFSIFCGLLIGTSLLPSPALAQHEQHEAGTPEKLGRVDFRVSCEPSVQDAFNQAVGLLHSFWYEKAEEEFAAVAGKDSNCAMAHWGIAMTIYHPLWEAPGPEALRKGRAAVEAAKRLEAKTQRERDYIAAIETFYKDFEQFDHARRAAAYEQAMEQLHRKYADDREATAFYTLALLGAAAATPGDKTYVRQKKAGSLAAELFALQPEHPGLTHYIIHAYDYPLLATGAVDAARRYAQIAPDSPHALHMPSHIFTRLGLWSACVSSNLAAATAARRHGLNGDMLHALDYVAYAYLQMGRDAEARQVSQDLPAIAGNPATLFAGLYATASIPARYALERHQWAEAAALHSPASTFPAGRYAWTEANLHFARALGSARSGNPDGAKEGVKRLEAIRADLLMARETYWAEQMEIQIEIIMAWVDFARNNRPEALRRMRAAADHEDATDKHPVTPGAVLPARELLGEMYLETNQPQNALAAFEAVLQQTPNRFNALYGAAQAAQRAGDPRTAKTHYSKLIEVGQGGSRPELNKARAFVAEN